MVEEKTWEQEIQEKLSEVKRTIGEIEKGLYSLRKTNVVIVDDYKIALDSTQRDAIKIKCIALKDELDIKITDLKAVLK